MYLAEYPYGRLISLAFGTLEGIAKHAARTERECRWGGLQNGETKRVSLSSESGDHPPY